MNRIIWDELKFFLTRLKSLSVSESMSINDESFCVSTGTYYENWIYCPNPERVNDAANFFRERDIAFMWPVYDSESLRHTDLIYAGDLTAMSLESNSVHESESNPDVKILRVKSHDDAVLWAKTAWHSFGGEYDDVPDNYYTFVDSLKDESIERFMLPDTLGILNPMLTAEYFKVMTERWPDIHFDFHAHNDYDLATSNVLAAVNNGARGVHTSLNGLGERAGNAPLSSIQAILKDHLHATTNINEAMLGEASKLVENLSGIAVPPNKPIIGDSVFTQVAGVHADGDNKNNLYCNELLPERFGRKREYALGKNSGKANILKNLEELGLELTPEQTRRVTDRIIELGDKKQLVTQEDLPYIISDVLKHTAPDDKVKLISYMVSTAYGLKPMASVKLEINGELYEESAMGDGQYDAFVRAVRHIYKNKLQRPFPWLSNYQVSIPPGGRTDALVQTNITWTYNDKSYRTRALDADQTEAAIKATIKMLNIIEP